MLALSLPIPLWGQLYTGSISGQVADPSGAVIPGATVTATDLERKYVHTTTTDTTGRYVIRAIPPGHYTLSVEANGFNRYVREQFGVDVNASVTVDAVLQVKTGAQSIVVTDRDTPILQTENASIGQTIDRKLINDLPLIGRGVADLIYLAPGVNPATGNAYGPVSLSSLDVTLRTQTNFVSNGTRNAQSDILVDGVSATLPENNGGITWTIFTPNVDSVQEFKVQQDNFSAEFGQTGTAVVNAITRSGTNEFHGTGYWFVRNNITNANNFFSNANGTPLPPIHWNNYGGTVGGPIKKNKTFFFANYDGWRSKNLHTASGAVPTALQRSGDFSELCSYYGAQFDANGRCSNPNGQIWDPFTATVNADGSGWTRQNYIPFNKLNTYISPGNPASPQGNLPLTPGNLIDPVSAKLAAYYPSPNISPGAPGYDPLFFNWYGQGAAATVNNEISIKVDHQLNSNNLLAVKFFHGWGNNDNGADMFHTPIDPFYASSQVSSITGGTVNFTSTISPTMIVTVSAGDSRASIVSQTPLNGGKYKDLSPVTTLGMPPYIADSGWNAFPQVYINEGSDIGIGGSAWANYSPGAEVRHLLGSVTKILGKHELKGGAEWRLTYLNQTFNESPAGIYNMDRWGSSQMQNPGGGSNGGNGFATFMMGMNDGWGNYQIPIRPAIAAKKVGMYVQDNWKVTSNLTLNLGLRYDIELPRTERYDRMSFFDPSLPSPLNNAGGLDLHGAMAFTGVNGVGRNIHPTYWAEIQPRFGFAYRLGKLTSIRGGYGIYYDQTLTGLVGLGGYTFDGYASYTNNNSVIWVSPGVPGSFLRNPYPNGLVQPCGTNCGSGYLLGQYVRVPVPQWNKTPQEQSWSLGIQRQLPWSLLGEATYIGKKGTHLYGGGINSLNYLPPAAAQRFLADPGAATAEVPNPLAGQMGQPATLQQFRLWLPYPQYGGDTFDPGLYGIANPIGDSSYHSLQLKLEKRFSNGLHFLGSWVWSKSIDDASVTGTNTTLLGGSVSLQNPFDLRGERALSQFNIPQVLQLAWVYELPFGRGRTFGNDMNRWVDLALGGWQINGSYRWDEGQPLAIGLASIQPLPTYGQRPNMLSELKQAPGVNINNYFACNTPDCSDVIANPPPYAFGNASRTDPHLRAPGNNIVSASLFKSFPLGFRETARAELRLEFFNALNHPVFAGPNTTFADPNFGKVTSQLNQPRQGQLGLKLYF